MTMIDILLTTIPYKDLGGYMDRLQDGDRFKIAPAANGKVWVSGLGLNVRFFEPKRQAIVTTIFKQHGNVVAGDQLRRIILNLDVNSNVRPNEIIAEVAQSLRAVTDPDAPITRSGLKNPFSLCVNRPVDFLHVNLLQDHLKSLRSHREWRIRNQPISPFEPRLPIEEVLQRSLGLRPGQRYLYLLSQGLTPARRT